MKRSIHVCVLYRRPISHVQSGAQLIHESIMTAPNHDTTTPLVSAHSFLTLHYRIALEDGAEVINTFSDKPATIQMGAGQLAPTLESCLIGLPEGRQQSFDLSADAAYGARNPELIQRISRAAFDANKSPDEVVLPGDLVQFPTPQGGSYAGVLKELTDTYALFDFNHPLAGKAIQFEVKLIGVL